MRHTGGHGFAGPVPPTGPRHRVQRARSCVRSDSDDQQHLLEFIVTRRGVEGFVEPRTTVTDVTLLLVAHDGEWTRRRVPSVQWAHDFANRNGVPSYDAAAGRHPRADARLQPRAEGTPQACSSTGTSTGRVPSPTRAPRSPARQRPPVPRRTRPAWGRRSRSHRTARGPRGRPLFQAGPAMSRWAHGFPSTNSSRNAAAKSAEPQRTQLCWRTSAILLSRTSSRISSGMGSRHSSSPLASAAAEHRGRRLVVAEDARRPFSPSATMQARSGWRRR